MTDNHNTITNTTIKFKINYKVNKIVHLMIPLIRINYQIFVKEKHIIVY